MSRAVVLAFVLVACRDKAPEPPPAAGSSRPAPADAKVIESPGSAGARGDAERRGGSIDPWVTPDAAPDTPENRRKRAEAALGRVASIKPKLQKLRGLTFERDVPTAYQTGAEFKAYVHREIVKDLPPDKAKDTSAALAHIGLLQKAVDLADVEEQAVTTQAGAYYDPAVKKFFLVSAPDSDFVLDTISAHELTHALQDQHFDLDKYLPPALDDDAATARRFVVEGDATFTMLLYGIASTYEDQPAIPPGLIKVIHGQIQEFAALDPAGLKDMTRKQAAAFSSMDADLKKSVDAMDEIPPVVLIPLLDSYMKGAFVALIAYEHGGWQGVNALFRDPPASTEQVLHPTTKLYPRERPHRVSLQKLAGYQELTNNVMGELQWWIYFSLWKPALATEASEGWGGDRYVVVRRGDGRLIGLFATVWDTAEDGKQFADAYGQTLAARFPGVDPGQAAKGVPRPDGGKVFVRRDGAKVYIVDGADDDKLLADLVRTARFE